MYVGAFFAIQRRKAKIFNKFSNGFQIHLWKFEQILLWLIDFDLTGLLEDFLAVPWAHLFKYSKVEKKFETIWFPIVSRIWKISTSLLKSLSTYKLRQNIWNKIEKSSKIGQHKKSLISTFQCFLTVIGKICLDKYTGHHLQGFLNSRKGWWWWWGLEILT